MAWGFLDPTRLFRKNWQNPNDLAMELYSQATEQGPATVDRPVVIAKQPYRPALKIEAHPTPQAQRIELAARSPSPPTEPTPSLDVKPILDPPQRPATTRFGAIVQAVDVASKAVDQYAHKKADDYAVSAASAATDWAIGKITEAIGKPVLPRPYNPSRAVEAQAVVGQQQRPSPPPAPAAIGFATVGLQSVPPSPVAPVTNLPVHTLAEPTKTGAVNAPQRPSPQALSVPHADPVVDIAGPVVFRGPEPVQMARPPQVWDDKSQAYVTWPPDSMTQLNQANWLMVRRTLANVVDIEPADYSNISNPKTGAGTANLFQISDDGTELTQYSDPQPTDVITVMQFKWTGLSIAQQSGDQWYVWPIGHVCFATGHIGANSSANCQLSAEYGGVTTKIYNNLPVAIDNGSGGDTTIIAAIDFTGRLLAIGQLCP